MMYSAVYRVNFSVAVIVDTIADLWSARVHGGIVIIAIVAIQRVAARRCVSDTHTLSGACTVPIAITIGINRDQLPLRPIERGTVRVVGNIVSVIVRVYTIVQTVRIGVREAFINGAIAIVISAVATNLFSARVHGRVGIIAVV